MENINKEKSFKNRKKYVFLMIFSLFFIIFSSFFLISCNKNVPVEEIYLSHTEISLFKGQRKKLYVNVEPDNANNFIIDFYSSDKTIAEVDKKGFVTSKKYGEVVITAKVRNTDVKAECLVTVNDGYIIDFAVDGDYQVYYEGQAFNENSIKVYAVYESGKNLLLPKEEYTLEAPEILTKNCEIKVSYKDFKNKFYYPLVLDDYVQKIEVTTPPTKTSYVIGEEIDKSGMEVSLVYASGKREVTQDFYLSSSKAEYKQKEIEVVYNNLKTTTPISTHAKIKVDTISELQSAIDNGITSIELANGSYNTTKQILISSKENILIFGESSKTSINGYDIIPIKIEGNCGNIVLADLTLTSIGENPFEHQIDLFACEGGNISLLNLTYSSLLQPKNPPYTLKTA